MFDPQQQLAPRATSRPTPPAPDPTVDRQDGSRAIEVTALFGDTVLQVRHLDGSQPTGRSSPLTWALCGAGWAVFVAGAALAVLGHYGPGTLLLLGGLGLGLGGNLRRRGEQGSPDYALGEASEADLHLRHPAIPAPCFPLVEATAGGHVLNFTPRMGGDLTLGASRIGLRELAESGRAGLAHDYPGTYRLPIPTDAQIKIDIGENTFLINSVAPARLVQSPLIARVDWNKQMFTGLSVGAHSLALMMVFLMPPDSRVLGGELFDRDMKVVEVLLTPRQLQEEVPDWLRRARQEQPAGPRGQAHKGPAGKMGARDSREQNRRHAIKGPAQNQDPHLSRRLIEQQLSKAGVLTLLGGRAGSHIASIFGRESALDNDAEDALGNLQGDQVGRAEGIGGLAPVGTGRGGGGMGEGTIGYGPLGTHGKGGPGGPGPGYGYGGVGALPARKLTTTPEPLPQVIVKGELDRAIIRRVIRQHINEIKFCYQSELQTRPDLYGRVVVQFSIMPTGQVAAPRIERSTLKSASVESCVIQAVRRWLFPRPHNGGMVVVSYPFVFHATGGADAR